MIALFICVLASVFILSCVVWYVLGYNNGYDKCHKFEHELLMEATEEWTISKVRVWELEGEINRMKEHVTGELQEEEERQDVE